MSVMSAHMDMEYENFDLALFARKESNLLKAKHIYSNAKTDSLELAIYNEKVDQIDTMIRKCEYKISGENSKSVEELMKEVIEETKLDERVKTDMNKQTKAASENI